VLACLLQLLAVLFVGLGSLFVGGPHLTHLQNTSPAR
jgi:hypothetical protein